MTQPYGPGYPAQQPQPPGQIPGQPPAPPPPPPVAPPGIPYQQPAYGPPVPVPVVRPDAPSAQMAMILGIVGLVGALVTCLVGFVGIGGIIFANKTEEEIARSGGTLGGEDKAKIGRITGWIGVVLASLGLLVGILYVLFFGAMMSRAPSL